MKFLNIILVLFLLCSSIVCAISDTVPVSITIQTPPSTYGGSHAGTTVNNTPYNYSTTDNTTIQSGSDIIMSMETPTFSDYDIGEKYNCLIEGATCPYYDQVKEQTFFLVSGVLMILIIMRYLVFGGGK